MRLRVSEFTQSNTQLANTGYKIKLIKNEVAEGDIRCQSTFCHVLLQDIQIITIVKANSILIKIL